MRLLLENFDGPLDLLLYLIKTQEINIFNIPIVLVTEQYLTYIDQAATLEFDKAGEYLAMAAQLIEIKAQYLIPTLQNRIVEDVESLAQMAEDDPRKPLVQQLMEYEAIRGAVEELERLPLLGRDTFLSGEYQRRQEEFDSLPAPIRGDAFSLAISLERVLLRFSERARAPKVRVRAQKISIQQRMVWLKRCFTTRQVWLLDELYAECPSRYELIVTIMAMLELSKATHIVVIQEELFGPIRMEPGPAYHESLPMVDDSEEKERAATA